VSALISRKFGVSLTPEKQFGVSYEFVVGDTQGRRGQVRFDATFGSAIPALFSPRPCRRFQVAEVSQWRFRHDPGPRSPRAVAL